MAQTDLVNTDISGLDEPGLRVPPRQIPGPRAHPFSYYQSLISRAPARLADRDAE